MCLGASKSKSDAAMIRPISVACPISTVMRHRNGIVMQTVLGTRSDLARTPRISDSAVAGDDDGVDVDDGCCCCWCDECVIFVSPEASP